MLTVLIVIGVITLITVILRRNLLGMQHRIQEAQNRIGVQLEEKLALLRSLAESVNRNFTGEKTVLDEIAAMASGTIPSGSPEELMKADAELGRLIGDLFAAAEACPGLKEHGDFNTLQQKYRETEENLHLSRQFYNDMVLFYNNTVGTFPGSLAAALFGFRKESFLPAGEAGAQIPE